MYVVVHHRFKDSEAALERGRQLILGEGAPSQVNVLQFYPSQDMSVATCLWESDSVASIQTWVDTTLGDSSENICYPVDAEHSFADRALGLSAKAEQQRVLNS